MVFDHYAGQIAAIECIARGFQAGVTTAACRSGFFVGHELDRSGQVSLNKIFAHMRRAPAGQINRRAGAPLRIVIFMGDNVVAHNVMHRKAFPGIAN